MRIECLLNEHKQAASTRRGCPTVEALAYSGLVSKLWSRHLDAGKDNVLKIDRSLLTQEGCALELQSKRTRRVRRQWSNRAVAWMSKEMSLRNPQWQTLEADERVALRRELAAEWVSKTEEERLQHVHSMTLAEEQNDARDAAASDAAPASTVHVEAWEYGNNQFPVSPNLLLSLVGKASGFASKAEQLRFDYWESLVIKDRGTISNDHFNVIMVYAGIQTKTFTMMH